MKNGGDLNCVDEFKKTPFYRLCENLNLQESMLHFVLQENELDANIPDEGSKKKIIFSFLFFFLHFFNHFFDKMETLLSMFYCLILIPLQVC